MYTVAGLLDVHQRTHQSMRKVLDHVGTLPPEELTRAMEGFSYPTLASQLHHLIRAEYYWMGVMQGEPRYEDDAAEHETMEALRALYTRVYDDTHAFLSSLTDDGASALRTVTKYNGDQAEIVPALALLRTQMHAYQHHGEIATMLRQMGHTFPQMLDFPVV